MSLRSHAKQLMVIQLLVWTASCALTPYVLGTTIQALIEFNDAIYKPERWHATLLMWAFTVLPVLINASILKNPTLMERLTHTLRSQFLTLDDIQGAELRSCLC